jgi:hypothetical protein
MEVQGREMGWLKGKEERTFLNLLQIVLEAIEPFAEGVVFQIELE